MFKVDKYLNRGEIFCAETERPKKRLDTVLTLAMLTAGAFLQSVGLLKKPQLVQWKGTATQVRLQV